MFEARLSQAGLLRRLVDSFKELVPDANFEATEAGLTMQAMDTSHVCLVTMLLRSDGFDHYRCDRPVTLGVKLASLAKLLKFAGEKDVITLKADDEPDSMTIMLEDAKADRVSDFTLKLLDIESEHLGIPETQYSANVRMPGGDYARIVRDLASIGDTVVVSATKDGVRFSTSGDIGTANVTVRNTTGSDLRPEQQTSVELAAPVCLSFGLRYLNTFAKAAVLSSHARLGLTKDLPVVVEWQIEDMGHLTFYLAPKIDDDDPDDAGADAGGMDE